MVAAAILDFKKKPPVEFQKKKKIPIDSYESIEAKKLDSTRDCKVHKILTELYITSTENVNVGNLWRFPIFFSFHATLSTLKVI